MKNNEITIDQARRVLEVVDAGLCVGLGNPVPGQMCIEAAVCYALGQPHSDEPECVHNAVRAFKIPLNDSLWSSNEARAQGMRRLAIAQLGTDDKSFDSKKFIEVLIEQTIRKIVPRALRASIKGLKSGARRSALEEAAVRCERDGDLAAAERALSAAVAAAGRGLVGWDLVATHAANAAGFVDAAAANAAYAATKDAAANAAYAAAANAANAAGFASPDAADVVLQVSADIGVHALRAAGAHGIKLMDQLIPA